MAVGILSSFSFYSDFRKSSAGPVANFSLGYCQLSAVAEFPIYGQ